MLPRFALGLAATLLTVVLYGCQKPTVSQTTEGVLVLGEQERTVEMERRLSLGARTLVLEGASGSINLAASEDDQAHLFFRVTGRGDTPEKALRQIDGLELLESGDETSYEFRIVPDNAALTRVDVSGSFPRGGSLEIVQQSGNTVLQRLDGPLDVLLTNGSVSYVGGSDNLKLVTGNGNVDADLQALTGTARITLQSSNGTVSAGVPADASADVAAETRAGSIIVRQVEFSKRRLAPSGAGARFAGHLGAATARLVLRTNNGDIIFRMAAQAPPIEVEMDAETDTLEVELPPAPVEDTTSTDVETDTTSVADTTAATRFL